MITLLLVWIYTFAFFHSLFFLLLSFFIPSLLYILPSLPFSSPFDEVFRDNAHHSFLFSGCIVAAKPNDVVHTVSAFHVTTTSIICEPQYITFGGPFCGCVCLMLGNMASGLVVSFHRLFSRTGRYSIPSEYRNCTFFRDSVQNSILIHFDVNFSCFKYQVQSSCESHELFVCKTDDELSNFFGTCQMWSGSKSLSHTINLGCYWTILLYYWFCPCCAFVSRLSTVNFAVSTQCNSLLFLLCRGVSPAMSAGIYFSQSTFAAVGRLFCSISARGDCHIERCVCVPPV